MAQGIFKQHDKAFARVSAYVVLYDGGCVARVAFHYPPSDAGRLYAYVHWLGQPMVRGSAVGDGYDKMSAAVAAATRKMTLDGSEELADFYRALDKDDGNYWYGRLDRAGFVVLRAV